MNNIRVFIDFGSTFTKVAAFDIDREELVARVQAPSSVDTDITVGLMEALDALREIVSISDAQIKNAVACSSAAGGLRMVCVGLVPDYTTKAGQMAALGAGAKVVGTFSYELSGSELREIAALRPDIVLLTGGTDGGNKKTIIHNSEALASISGSLAVVIVAGNKSAYDDIESNFRTTGLDVSFTANVMPEFGKLELQPVNDRIRELFIGRITKAKGISRVEDIIGGVLMPTPSAILKAAELISGGVATKAKTSGTNNSGGKAFAGNEKNRGLGELLLVDVGGATTDIYSIATGAPTRDGVHTIGLREPYAKRTVEGDLGLYHNLDSLAGIYAEESRYSADAPEDEAGVARQVEELRKLLSVPSGEAQTRYQLELSRLAVRVAVERHAGRVESFPTTAGDVWVQRGKDLGDVPLIIGAGGPLAFSSNPRHVLEGAASDPSEPYLLKPKSPEYLLDEKYILFAIGLLSVTEPDIALCIAKKYLSKL